MERQTISPSALAQFLVRVLPTVAAHPGPSRCWVWKAIHFDIPGLGPLSAAIQIVEQRGQIAALECRVRDEHRKCRALTEHTDVLEYVEQDARVVDCLTEACAFAWADLRGLGDTQFNYQPGMPDVHVPPDLWVEAKAVHESLLSRDAWFSTSHGEPHSGEVASPDENRALAFADKLMDSKNKFARSGSGRRVVFFNLTSVDMAQMPDTENVLARYVAWLDQVEAADPTISIVLCYAYNWRHPIRDPFLIQAR